MAMMSASERQQWCRRPGPYPSQNPWPANVRGPSSSDGFSRHGWWALARRSTTKHQTPFNNHPQHPSTQPPVPSKPTAHHKPTTEHRALARVPTRGCHAFTQYQPGRRHDERHTACGSRDSRSFTAMMSASALQRWCRRPGLCPSQGSPPANVHGPRPGTPCNNAAWAVAL